MSIELRNVTYTYMPGTPFERRALEQVSLVLEEGSFVALAGHTGSGKSTLVQHLNGLLHPTTGQVLVDGIDLCGTDKASKKAAKEAGHRVGMVFQYPEHQLFEETVYADIAFGPRAFQYPEQETEARVREAMEIVDLPFEKYKDKSPFQISGGERRRVAVAGVLALRPKYLVLDEPTAGLDPKGREQLIRQMKRLHREKKMTIVFVSHSMEDIARLANRVIIMRQGGILVDDVPERAFMESELLEQAGLRPPRTVMLLQALKEAGLPVETNIFAAEAAAREIYTAIKGKKGILPGKGLDAC